MRSWNWWLRNRIDRLAELDRAKNAFFTNVSNEFQTPLTLLLAPIEELLQAPDAPVQQRIAALELVQRNARRLQRLVATLLGYSQAESLPDTDWLDKYIDPADQPAVLAAIQRAVATKTNFEYEHRVRRTDGSLGWTLSRAVPLLDDDGEIIERVGTATDATDRHQCER